MKRLSYVEDAQCLKVKSQFEQMEIAYNNNEGKKFYEELSIISEGFKTTNITN